MGSFNIFKINNNRISSLKNELSKNYEPHNHENLDMVLHISKFEKNEISWVGITKQFGTNLEAIEKNPSAIIIIENNNKYYCIGYGYAHFILV